MPSPDELIDSALRFSRYGQRLLAANPSLRDALRAGIERPFERAEMQAFLATQTINNESDLKRVLRTLKKHVALRLMVRDLSGLGDLVEVMSSISQFAELAIQEALQRLSGWQQAIYGTPMSEESGTLQELIVVAMGKLGGHELNVSSDIDLIYIYPGEGLAGKLSNHEYFTKLAQKLTQTISELTADGYVFRVDLRLRPYGESGPVVSSFAMLEEYFITQGREWERYAWIKARPLSGDAASLMALARPFVYRKYLDYGAFASMRDLHAQIRREVARHDLADNIKIGPGGIREIEFIAQVFQLIRGGKEVALQLRPTRATLDLIAARHLLPPETVAQLQRAYALLRNLEHRLQYLDDAQTQALPAAEADRELIAQAMGARDWATFNTQLMAERKAVDEHFGKIFSTGEQPLNQASPWFNPEDAPTALAQLGYTDPAAAAERLKHFKLSQRYRSLPATSQARLDLLMPRIIEAATQHGQANATLSRMIALIETIARRESYLALLTEYPDTLTHVVRVCGASAWAADYLTQHPILLDELLDTHALMEQRDWPQLAQKLRQALDDFPDTERQMDILRHFKHAQTFHLLAQDLEGILPIEKLSDELSALAECVVAEVLRLAWLSLLHKHCDAAHFAIIGYGKLGGKELGYASDLDIVFLYDDPHPDASTNYARLAQRLNSWLSTLTPAGILYETDLRLRPEGASGLMVSSMAAFEQYQQESAWVWEHQALTRARFVAGDAAIGASFARIRHSIICRARDPAALREEVICMRQKMRDAQRNPAEGFDLKHEVGGIVDVEFLVQFLVLAYAHTYPQLADNVGNLALLARAAACGLIAADTAQAVQNAYREFRRIQHRERMQGSAMARVAPETLAQQTASVRALWGVLLGENTRF